MAKGKNAAALFEVINKSKGLRPEVKRSGISTPRWWFNGGKKAGPQTDAGSPVVAHTAPKALAAVRPASAPAVLKAAPVVVPPLVAPPVVEAAGRTTATLYDALPPGAVVADGPVVKAEIGTPLIERAAPLIERGAPVTPKMQPVRPVVKQTKAPRMTKPAPAKQLSTDGPDEEGRQVVVDTDRGEISLRVSFVSAAVAVFAVGALVVVALLAGKLVASRNIVATNETTEGLLAGPANPGVLNAKAGQGGSAEPEITGTPPRPPQTTGTPGSALAPGSAQTASESNRGKPSPAPAGSDSVAAVPVPTKAVRDVGMNYLIAQSFDVSEEADAKEVVRILASKGVPTTIERKVQGYGSRLVVVTTQGFARVRSPEFEAIRKRIDQVSAEQSRVDRKWRVLAPQGYRWR